MPNKLLEIQLFGPFSVRTIGTPSVEVNGSKHKALFALLATGPSGRRTRAFLQETLWGYTSFDGGRLSLRRAIADIKVILGDVFPALITSTNAEIKLDLSRVRFLGQPGQGLFLESLTLREPQFIDWVKAIRAQPEQLDGLFGIGARPSLLASLPSVAVIPFRTLEADDNLGILGDWLAEEICRALSRSPLLNVISHLSCRRIGTGGFEDTLDAVSPDYGVDETSWIRPGKKPEAAPRRPDQGGVGSGSASRLPSLGFVRDTLNANYLVAGTLRRLRDELILDADFLDVASGRILWTQQIVSTLPRLLKTPRDILLPVIKGTFSAIAGEALKTARGRVLAEIDDHRLLMAGIGLMHQTSLQDFVRSRACLEEAIRRQPLVAELHAWLAKWYILSVINGWTNEVISDTQRAVASSSRALDLDPDNPFCLAIDGFAQNNLLKRLDIAEQRYETSLAKNPNEAISWLLQGTLRAFQDQGDLAVEAVERANRLSPVDPFGYFYASLTAGAHLAEGKFETALDFADRSLVLNDRYISTLRIKITALHCLDRQEDARATARQLLAKQPDFTVESYRRYHPASTSKTGRTIVEALIAAGLPR